MANARVSERCSCGAEFTYNGPCPLSATSAWREHHCHDVGKTVATCSGCGHPVAAHMQHYGCYCRCMTITREYPTTATEKP